MSLLNWLTKLNSITPSELPSQEKTQAKKLRICLCNDVNNGENNSSTKIITDSRTNNLNKFDGDPSQDFISNVSNLNNPSVWIN
jgi:hypothetical protein